MPPKNLNDLQGWSADYSYQTPQGGNYMLLSNPEETQIATIRMKDEVVLMMVDVEKQSLIYVNPKSGFATKILPTYNEHQKKRLIEHLIEEWRELKDE